MAQTRSVKYHDKVYNQSHNILYTGPLEREAGNRLTDLSKMIKAGSELGGG